MAMNSSWCLIIHEKLWVHQTVDVGALEPLVHVGRSEPG